MVGSTSDGTTLLGKRRRSGGPETGTLKKKTKLVESEDSSKISGKTAKRKRPRTKGLRNVVRTEIEKALRLSPSPISHLFTDVNDDGVPHAPFIDVCRCLKLPVEKLGALRPQAIVAISNMTTVFKIAQCDNRLMVSFVPLESTVAESTVYLDNLPEGCNLPKLQRLVRKFGTVVEIRLPRTFPRPIDLPGGTVDFGKRAKSFAFVQFTEKEAALEMVKAYSSNSMTLLTSDGTPKKTSLGLIDLKKRIRLLSGRRRRRSRGEAILLCRLRTIFSVIARKERALRKQSRKTSHHSSRDDTKVQGEKEVPSHEITPLTANGLNETTTSNGHNDSKDVTLDLNTTAIRKTKRKRRRRRRVLHPAYIHTSVATHFANIQVLPFLRYRELRQDYLNLQKKSKANLKTRLYSEKVPSRKKNINKWIVDYRDAVWSVKKA